MRGLADAIMLEAAFRLRLTFLRGCTGIPQAPTVVARSRAYYGVKCAVGERVMPWPDYVTEHAYGVTRA